MHWKDLPTYLAVVTVVATLAVVVLAKQTVNEAKNATTEEKRTVAELKTLVQAAKDTAGSSASTTEVARKTAEIAKATLEAADRHRQREQLRAVGRLIQDIHRAVREQIFWEAQPPPDNREARPNWRCIEQDELAYVLVGAVPELLKCRALAETSGLTEVRSAAANPDNELGEVFRIIRAEGG